jgi:thioesterase domain-containing protein
VSNLPKGSTGKLSRSRLADALPDVRRVVPAGSMLEFQIARIWQGLIRRADFGVEDNFFGLGGDSFLALKMLAQVETFTGQSIPPYLFGVKPTIHELANVIMQRIPATEELVTCAQLGTGTPLFYCHGDFLTRGFYAARLANLLGRDQSVYLLHPFRDSELTSDMSMETMARAYVPHVLAGQPNGAFRFAGFCNGGLLAWEIAHQIAAAGRRVESVVLVDTPSFNAWPIFRGANHVLSWIGGITSKTMGKTLDMRMVWELARRIDRYVFDLRDLASKKDCGAFVNGGQPDDLRLEWQAAAIKSASKFLPIMTSYIPPKIDTAIFCALSQEQRRKKEYSPFAWRRLAREVHYQQISGEHHNCVTIHLHELADLLRDVLSDAHPKSNTRPVVTEKI